MEVNKIEDLAVGRDTAKPKRIDTHFIDGCLMGLIASEDTCVGFLLAGIGEYKTNGQENFLAVDEKTPTRKILEFFETLYHRPDIAIILIEKEIVHKIEHSLKVFNLYLPVILEIPSKNAPFIADQDLFLRNVKKATREDE